MLFKERAEDFSLGWIARALTPTTATATSTPATSCLLTPAKSLFICCDGVCACLFCQDESGLTQTERSVSSIFWCERSDNFFETPVVPQRIPQRMKTQIAVSHMTTW